MAIFHLAAKIHQRSKGHSAVAGAAYQSRAQLVDERTGVEHNYSRKSRELLFEGIFAPKDAPDWTRDRAQLWNHVEAFERRRDAQLARAFDIALPCELTLDQSRYALQDWVKENFTRKGLIADVAIHAPHRDGDERNIHAHVMVCMRKLDGTEFAAKKERTEDRAADLEAIRESWAKIGNRHLERHGFEPSLDHRSYEEQGINREPTIHVGKAANALERDGVASDRGDINREIEAENERRVIDLAAERAKREVEKETTAAPAVNDLVPPATAAPGQTVEPPSLIEQGSPMAEKLKTEPLAPAPTSPGLEEPQRASEGVFVDKTGMDVEATVIKAADIQDKLLKRFFDAVAEKVEAVFHFLTDMISPPPPPTAQQVHEQRQAAGNLETLHARAYAEEVEVKAEVAAEQVFVANKEEQMVRMHVGNAPITRPTTEADHYRDWDREQEEEREQERER